MPAIVAEVLTNSAGGLRLYVLHVRLFGSRRGDHDGVVHRSVIGQNRYDLRDGRALLADGIVDTDQVVALVVDNGIEGNSSLAGLAVTNNQLPLSTADRNHTVDRFQSRGHRLSHGLAVDDARCQPLQRNGLVATNGPLVVDGLAKRVDHATDHGVTDRHAHDSSGTLDLVPFADLGVVAQEHDANLVLFQVHGDTRHVVRKSEQLSSHDLVQAMHAGNAVTETDHGTHFIHGDLGFVILDLLADEFSNFVCFDLRHMFSSYVLVFSSQHAPI